MTTKLGDKEYRKGRNRELDMEKEEEMRIRMEISRRWKEKCKERSKEMHPENQGERENPGHKRRKLEETGEYKTVLSKKQAVREERSQVGDEKVTKRRRIEKGEGLETLKEPYRILGGILHDYEICEIDWEEERRKKRKRGEKERQRP